MNQLVVVTDCEDSKGVGVSIARLIVKGQIDGEENHAKRPLERQNLHETPSISTETIRAEVNTHRKQQGTNSTIYNWVELSLFLLGYGEECSQSRNSPSYWELSLL